MLTIAHLSDTHFGLHADVAARTERVLRHLVAMTPAVDVVLVTGDIADHGTAEEYEEARRVLGAWPGPAPLWVCPGNHDVREPFGATFPSQGRPGFGVEDRLDAVHDLPHRGGIVRFVMLDSLVAAPPGERIDHGELTASSLELLDATLAEGHPTVVCLHHPPAPVHIGLMDPIGLRDPDALAAVLRRHGNVAAVLCGHAHTMAVTTFADRRLVVGGGVASTVTLDAEDLPLVDLAQPPSFAVHLLDEGGHLVSHWRTV